MTLLIDVLGFGLIIPILPKLVTQMAANNPANAAREFGMLISCFGLMQFISSPFLGNLSDRFGRRPVLLLSLLFTCVDYVIMATAPNIAWLFLGRILSGITSASFTVASAYIADVSPPEKRAQSYGIIGAAFGAGFVLGPAAGGILGHISTRLPFWCAAVLSLINFLYGTFILPESLDKSNRRSVNLRQLNPVRGLNILTKYRWVLLFAGALVLIGLAQQCLQSTWVLYTSYKFKWTPTQNGMSLALIGVMSILVQLVVLPKVVRVTGDARTVLIGFVFNIVGFMGIALSADSRWMIVTLIIWSLSGISGPTMQGLLSKQFPSNEQGAIQGALTSLQSVTAIVGPLVATYVFAYFTSINSPRRLPGSPFLLGAMLNALAVVVAYQALSLRAKSLATEP